MRTRPILFGLILAIVLVATTVPNARGPDPGPFEVMGIQTGMTLPEVQRAVEQQKLGPPELTRAPSFEQEVALARKEPVKATDYEGVQTLRAGNGDRRIQVFRGNSEGPYLDKDHGRGIRAHECRRNPENARFKIRASKAKD